MKVSIIVPAYNEEKTIRGVLEKLKEVPLDKEIIVVDDCSKDGTLEVVRQIGGVRLLHHTKNRGKGSAVSTGMRYATGDCLIIQDADLEYDPFEIPRIVEEIEKGAKVVYGSRFLGKGKFLRASYLANRFLSWLTGFLFRIPITDMETCYKCLHRDVYRKLALRARRFDMEPEITAKVSRMGYRIKEVPITYSARSKEEGKKIGVKDGIWAIYTLLHYRFSGMRKWKSLSSH